MPPTFSPPPQPINLAPQPGGGNLAPVNISPANVSPVPNAPNVTPPPPVALPNNPSPTSNSTASSTPLDPKVVALAQAIRTVESNNNFTAKGASGEYGAYQWMPASWKGDAQQVLGNPNAPMTPANQNAVAYSIIKSWKDQGLNPAQIAGKWNSGMANGWENNVGTNAEGVQYNTPKYVKSVVGLYQQYANGGQPSSSQSSQSPSVSGFIGNVATSAENLIGGIGNAVIHPVQTAENLGGVVAGGVEKLFGVQNSDTQKFDSMVNYFGQRYGGNSLTQIMGNIAHTAYTDPVGMALDLSTLVDGIGAGVGALGKIADISKAADLAKASDYISSAAGLIKGSSPEAAKLLETPGTLSQVGSSLRTAAEYTNPIGLAAKGAGMVAGLGARVAGESLGASTGMGYGAIKGIFQGSSAGGEAAAAVRAGLSGDEEGVNALVDSAQQAYSDMKMNRSNEYQTALQNIQGSAHTLNKTTLQPVVDTFDNLLNKYNIKQTSKGLDFSNSALRNESASVDDIQDISNEIKKYTTGVKQITPVNIDDLKQFIDARYAVGSRGGSFTTQLNTVLRKILKTNVPDYAKMTEKYQEASDQLQEFRQALSVGGKAGKETILKKLTSTLRNNNEYRTALLKQLSEGADKHLLEHAAGASAHSWIPEGMTKYVEGLAAFINPHILLALPFESPRVVGEFVNALGKGNRVLEKIGNGLIKYNGPLIGKTAVVVNNSVQPVNKNKGNN